MVCLGVVAGAWASAGAAVPASHGARVTGDEPQYLLTAISLGEDGDLDVADERAERRWEPFHEAGPPLVQEEALASGRRVSPHDPLLPALLAGPTRVGGWLGAKLALTGLAGSLTAAMLWVAVRRFAAPLGTAAAVIGVFALSAPLAVYGTQLYPELPAALAVTLAVGSLLGLARPSTTVATGLALVALPWLSVKYVPVAAAVAAVALIRLLQAGRRDLALGLAGGLLLAGGAYLAAHQAWYGGWTAYAAGDHFAGGEFTVVGHTPDYTGRSVRLAGLLLDRHFGLAPWQPAFLLAVPAAVALARRRPRGWEALAVPLLAGWLTATYAALTMHGWWWPGRQVVVVIPLLVLAVTWWAARSRRRLHAVAALGMTGVATFGFLVAEGLLGDLTLVVDFERTINPLVRSVRAALPDYRSPTAATWVLHGAWLVALGALAARGFGRRARHPPTTTTTTTTIETNLTMGEAPMKGQTTRKPSRVLLALVAALALVASACDDDGGDVRETGTETGTGTGTETGTGTGTGTGDHDAEEAKCEPVGTDLEADTEVAVVLSEFIVQPTPAEAPAGAIEFAADNQGGFSHELVVVRAGSVDDVPVADDGSADLAALAAGTLVGEIEPFPAQESCDGTFELDAGSYVLLCNVIEEDGTSHFGEGMHTAFTVA